MSLSPSLDYYAILGLTYEATTDEIRAAYRQIARRFHPDVNPNQGAGLHFRDVVEAYDTLSNETQHRRYRQQRKQYGRLPTFNTELTTSKRVLQTISEPQVLYVLFDVYAKVLREDRGKFERTPLNIALVLDRSKSMLGDRLDRVKSAAHEVIGQMQPNDRVSVVSFSDRADVLVPSTEVAHTNNLRAMINIMAADGGTEIFQGLEAGYRQVEAYFDPNFVNHIILITDGRTFGDEELCIELAGVASNKGIGISAMGIGDEWNDAFLDQLAGRTGGVSDYINSPAAVAQFLNDRVTKLGKAFAEPVELIVACDADVTLESAFRLSPSAQPLLIDEQPIQLGTLERRRPISVLLQLQMPANMPEGNRTIMKLDVSGDVLSEGHRVPAKVLADLSIDAAQEPQAEIPPPNIVDALSKMTLYRMQERTEEAITSGNPELATRRLEHLATRLLDIGQDDLALQARTEARRIAHTHAFSEEGRKSLKFGTRSLMTRTFDDEEES